MSGGSFDAVDNAEYQGNVLALLEAAEAFAKKHNHLNLCRVFYIKYPQICATVSHKLKGIGESKYLPDLLPEESETTGGVPDQADGRTGDGVKT